MFQGKKSDKSNDTLDPIRPLHHKKRFIFLAIVFLALIFAGGYVFYPQSDTQNQAILQTTDELVIVDSQIKNIIYVFGTSFDSKADIFSRDLNPDSERKSLHSLSSINATPDNSFAGNLAGFQVSSGYAVVVGENEIWGSSNGQKAELLYTLEESFGSAEIVSALINHAADKVAFCIMNKASGTVDLWVLDLNSKTTSSVANNVKTAPFAWSYDSRRIFMGPNVLSGDMEVRPPSYVDVSNGQQTPLFESSSSNDFGAYNASIDGMTSAYIKPSLDKNKKPGPPYKLFTRDLDNGQLSEVKDIRSKNAPSTLVFDQVGENLFWAEESKLYRHNLAEGSTETALDNGEENITAVYAATSTQAIIGIKLDDGTYSVNLVDLKKKTKSLIMETTDATSAVGFVSDK